MSTMTSLCPRCWGDASASEETCAACGAARPADGWVSPPLAFRGIYELRARVSRGARTALFQAVDTRDGHPVLIKVQRRDGAREAVRAAVGAITAEQAALLALADAADDRERCVPQVLGMERTDPAYLAIEHVDLPTLEQVVALRTLGPLDVAWLGIGLLDAVRALGAQHLVHEDLRPSTVLVREGDWHVVLGDLEACRRASDPGSAADLPEPGAAHVGAFSCAAPLGADALAARCDAHVAAQLLWFAATGAAPYPQTIAPERIAALASVPERPAALPDALYRILAAALSPSPDDRPTAAGLQASLEAYARAVLRADRLDRLRDQVRSTHAEVAPLASLPGAVAGLEEALAALGALEPDSDQAAFDAECERVSSELVRVDGLLETIRSEDHGRLATLAQERDAALADAAAARAAADEARAALAERAEGAPEVQGAASAELEAAVAAERARADALAEEVVRVSAAASARQAEDQAALRVEQERVLALDQELRRTVALLEEAQRMAEPTQESLDAGALEAAQDSLKEMTAALAAERSRSVKLQNERDEAAARVAAAERRASAPPPPPPEPSSPWPMAVVALVAGLVLGALGVKLMASDPEPVAMTAPKAAGAGAGAKPADAKSTAATQGESVAKPTEAAAKPSDVPAKPGDAAAKPSEAPAKPSEAPAKPEATKPVEAAPAAKPVAAAAKPAEAAPAKAAEPKPAKTSAKSLVEKGWKAVESGDYSSAKRAFDDAVAAGGGSDARFGRGYAREKSGDIPGAVADYCGVLKGPVDTDRKRELEGILRRLGKACE